jgi:hypothetical protein
VSNIGRRASLVWLVGKNDSLNVLSSGQNVGNMKIAGSQPISSTNLPWPRAVGWLAVVAHFCVADVIGVAREKTDVAAIRNASVLFAQADLILVWLFLGATHWIRRIPWSLCGLCGAGLVFYMHNFEQVTSVAFFTYALQCVATAMALGCVRYFGLRIVRAQLTTEPVEEQALPARQFSILDLLGAALAVAIAVSWVLRMQPPTLQRGEIGGVGMLTMAAAPLSVFACLAAYGMRGERSLVVQMMMGAALAIFLRGSLGYGVFQQLSVLYGVHWFVAAATLWIFQMCGYRLVQTTRPTMEGEETARLAVFETAASADWIGSRT